MAKALNTKTLPVEKAQLHCPPLEEIAKVLSKALKSNFETVSVEVCDCPDLRKAPFHLAAEGLNGKSSLIDVGGPPYLLPTVNREKLYSFKNLNDICGNVNPALIIGAGAGPYPYASTNCEMVANLKIVDDGISNETRIVKIIDEEKGDYKVEVLPDNENRFALLGNFFLSEGKPGKVLKIECRKRIGADNFISATRNALNQNYNSKSVGLGGVFILNEGSAKQHIMPDFSKVPLNSEDELNDWLCFFDMKAPLIAVGTLISEDPGLDLRVQHFHSFNLNGNGGHYHYDTTPDNAHYTAFFTTAEYVYRIDKPKDTHQFGRD